MHQALCQPLMMHSSEARPNACKHAFALPQTPVGAPTAMKNNASICQPDAQGAGRALPLGLGVAQQRGAALAVHSARACGQRG